MTELSAKIAGQVIGVLLWSAVLNAPILQWLARKLGNWHIKYSQAYVVSIKAGFVALIVGDTAALSLAMIGNQNQRFLESIAFIIGITSWWFAHSNALLKLSDSTGSITAKQARSISTSVIGYILGGLSALGLAVALIASVLSSPK